MKQYDGSKCGGFSSALGSYWLIVQMVKFSSLWLLEFPLLHHILSLLPLVLKVLISEKSLPPSSLEPPFN